MGYVEGTNRDQAVIVALDEMVSSTSMVRIIDRYVEAVDLTKMGFTHTTPAQNGRPCYSPPPMTKLYLYGYEEGIRSSRKLEKETHRNVEVMWLVNGLTPDHKTIAEFRRKNIRPLQKLFHEFVKLCRSWDLVGGELIAVDGTKFKASNNKKMNFSRKKLDAWLAISMNRYRITSPKWKKRTGRRIPPYLKSLKACWSEKACTKATGPG